jgi:hypothetical protein
MFPRRNSEGGSNIFYSLIMKDTRQLNIFLASFCRLLRDAQVGFLFLKQSLFPWDDIIPLIWLPLGENFSPHKSLREEV